MELGAASVLVQLLLILVLMAVFIGRRRMRSRQDRLAGAPPAPNPTESNPEEFSLVPEELLPACFADTCADCAQVDVAPATSMSCTIAPQAQHSA